MLGKAADQFFKKQNNERIISQAPNGNGRSLTLPDMGDKGTGRVFSVPGQFEMPGPQTSVNANAILPGMGEAPALTPIPMPAQSSWMPGMNGIGFLDSISTKTKLMIGGGIALLAYLKLRGRRKR